MKWISWISVKDNLPEEGLSVLVAIEDGAEPVWIGYLNLDAEWRTQEGMTFENEVTHWMELPEPPPEAKESTTC